MRISLEKFAGLANARVVWTDGPIETLRDVLAARAVLVPGADAVVLGSMAHAGSRWLQKLRLAAYLGGQSQEVSRIDEHSCVYIRHHQIAGLTASSSANLPISATQMRLADEQRTRALFVVSTQTGGTPQTNQDLMEALAGRTDCYLLRCDSKGVSLLRWSGEGAKLLRHVRLPKRLEPFPHVDDNYDRVVAGWLAEYQFDIVHIRHLVWHSLSLPRLAKAFGIPVVFSFHDFYTICPTIRLTDENDVFCGGTCTATTGQCKHELWKTKKFPPLKNAAVHRWREAMAPMLAACDAFVTTSPSTRDLIQRFFPVTRQKPFPIIGHGRDFEEFERVGRFPEAGEKVRVLVPGNISATKGARVLERLQALNGDGRFEFHLVGQYASALKGTPNLVFHGPYDRNNFGERVKKIAPHFGVVLSIWPETFCHTLTEMWASGLPVAGFDLGAVGERIRRHGGGWLISLVTAEAAFAKLQAIASDRARFEQKLAEVAAWQEGPGVAENCAWMADAYDELYRSLLSGPVIAASPPALAAGAI
jgi:glycosyltransferase involved in cell wall biosynthesis